MRVILVVASSQDGFITKDGDPNPSSWTSTEDQIFYRDIKARHKLLVFGKNTYDAKNKIPTPPETPEKRTSQALLDASDESRVSLKSSLTVILTSKPKQYAHREVKGVLEFASLTPQEFVKKYEDKFKTCLILGGSYVYTSFLKAGLIDEIYLTIEPVKHGSGVPFLRNAKKLKDIVDLPQPETTKLNNTGTMLEHYILKK